MFTCAYTIRNQGIGGIVEIRIREKCTQCGGTGTRRNSNKTGYRIPCGYCRGGYNKRWVPLTAAIEEDQLVRVSGVPYKVQL